MNIVFVCTGGPDYAWDESSLEQGIGGSEECLIMLAREFCQKGHEVVVFNHCESLGTIAPSGVLYFDLACLDQATGDLLDTADLLITWRNWYPAIGRKAKLRYHSTHDIPVGCHHPCTEEMERTHENALETINRIVYLNNYHRGLSPWWPDKHSAVIPIGINQNGYEVTDIQREPLRVLYFSHPNRGLDQLRSVWPQVHAAVPDATLASFWWEPSHWRDSDPNLGILPMRRLNSREAALETMRAGVFGYPCVFAPEISPATTIRAQMGGAVPVVVLQGGMVDTVKWGTKLRPDQAHEFGHTLISALMMSRDGHFDYARGQMMAWARDTYSWSKVADQWLAQAQADLETK